MRFRILSHKFLLCTLLAVSVLLVSCSKTYKDIELKDVKVEKLKVSSLRSLDATLAVAIDNPAVQRFRAENLTGTVYQKGVKVASFSSADAIQLEPKSVSENRIKVRLLLENPSAVLSYLADRKKVDLADFTVDIQVDITSGILKFPYSKKGMKVDSMLKDDPFKDF